MRYECTCLYYNTVIVIDLDYEQYFGTKVTFRLVEEYFSNGGIEQETVVAI